MRKVICHDQEGWHDPGCQRRFMRGFRFRSGLSPPTPKQPTSSERTWEKKNLCWYPGWFDTGGRQYIILFVLRILLLYYSFKVTSPHRLLISPKRWSLRPKNPRRKWRRSRQRSRLKHQNQQSRLEKLHQVQNVLKVYLFRGKSQLIILLWRPLETKSNLSFKLLFILLSILYYSPELLTFV